MVTTQLAVHGGTPVRTRPFPSWPVFDQAEEQALLQVLRSGNWWQFAYAQGVELREDEEGERAETSRFEEEFAAAHDCRFGIAAMNGTATLELILRSLDIGPGDEVIVPPYTFIASASSILSIGAVPIFVDIHPETFTSIPRASRRRSPPARVPSCRSTSPDRARICMPSPPSPGSTACPWWKMPHMRMVRAGAGQSVAR